MRLKHFDLSSLRKGKNVLTHFHLGDSKIERERPCQLKMHTQRQFHVVTPIKMRIPTNKVVCIRVDCVSIVVENKTQNTATKTLFISINFVHFRFQPVSSEIIVKKKCLLD